MKAVPAEERILAAATPAVIPAKEVALAGAQAPAGMIPEAAALVAVRVPVTTTVAWAAPLAATAWVVVAAQAAVTPGTNLPRPKTEAAQ